MITAVALKQKPMVTTKSNKFQNTITFGQLLGVGFSLLGAIIIFVVMVNVRLSNLENNQSSLKDSYKEAGEKMDKFEMKMDKFAEGQNIKFDRVTEILNDIKVLLQNKVDKK